MNEISVKVCDDVTLVVHCEGAESPSVLDAIQAELSQYFDVGDESPLSIPEKIEQLREKYHIKKITIRGGGDYNE